MGGVEREQILQNMPGFPSWVEHGMEVFCSAKCPDNLTAKFTATRRKWEWPFIGSLGGRQA